MTWRIENGDCLDMLPAVPAGSIDAVITDPPYPCIRRPYGRLAEAEWHDLMDGVVAQVRRVLRPSGSAVFVLQPNSRRVGEMRLWPWEFLLRTAKDWNLIQDVYWWNHAAMPTVHVRRENGLLRPSVKLCLWFGPPDCWRDQRAVLWRPSVRVLAERLEDRCLRRQPSGYTVRRGRAKQAVLERGGSTPFNLIPLANTDSVSSSGRHGHPAGTPRQLCDWWVRYICPPFGVVLDPFAGAGTVGEAAVRNGRSYVGIEKEGKYVEVARRRLEGVATETTPASLS
jgi:hypothetical protein